MILAVLLSGFTFSPLVAQEETGQAVEDIDELVDGLRQLSATRPEPDPEKIKELQRQKIELAGKILEHPALEEPQRFIARITQLQSYVILFNIQFRNKQLDDEFSQQYRQVLEEAVGDDDERIAREGITASASFYTGSYVLNPDENNAVQCADYLHQLNELDLEDPLIQATRRLLLEQLWNSDQPKVVFEKILENDPKVATIVLDQINESIDKPTADFRWSKHFAKFGDFASQRKLALMYETGTGTRQNDAQAARWYTRLSAAGDLPATVKLGDFYLAGRGFAKDARKAVEYYRQAAKASYRVAQFKLGQCYLNGTGVKQSRENWETWIKAAAENANQVDVSAIYNAIDFTTAADSFLLFYESLVDQYPDDIFYLNNLAYSLLISSTKDAARALELVDKAIANAPEDFSGLESFIDTKATALKQLQRFEEAAELFESILDQVNDNRPVLESLIECYQTIDPAKADRFRNQLESLTGQ